jgi:hypothetical protein
VPEFGNEPIVRQLSADRCQVTAVRTRAAEWLKNSNVVEISDLHEHLGQLIAYARMNGVKPPWSK